MNNVVGCPWFRSTTGLVVMSHNGAPTGHGQLGTLGAFHNAQRKGYRWFQVDALPIQDDLISLHAIFGSKRGLLKKDREAVRPLLGDVPTLAELITDPELIGSYWNIEMKSKKGLSSLLQLLEDLAGRGIDLRTIMVSSPVRPSVLRAVAATFPPVALAAPVIHGGVFGVRFLGRRRAQIEGRPFDCHQVYHRFIRSRRAADSGPLRQAWTIGKSGTLDRILGTTAQPIVDSKRLGIRPGFDEAPRADAEGMPSGTVRAHTVKATPRAPLTDTRQVDAVAIGGGGWRGAFGGIGAVMYLADAPERWRHIKDVVGISGGSFAVAALSRGPDVADDSTFDDKPADELPADAMRQLLGALQTASRRTAAFVSVGAAVGVAVAAAIGWLLVRSWNNHGTWMLPITAAIVLFASLLVRLLASLRWTAIVKAVFGKAKMRTSSAVTAEGNRARRYSIGATGLNDGRLYSFTSDPIGDTQRWIANPELPTPLGDASLAFAVVRATSLPGLGQLGTAKLPLPGGRSAPNAPRSATDWVPDRLVDGGLFGIFGRVLVHVISAEQQPAGPPLVLVVDAGRRLPINNNETFKDHLTGVGERLSVVLLLARWLKVALEVAYRDELKRVRDNQISDNYRYRLVRLAEEEDQPGVDAGVFSPSRFQSLNRLYVLRDQVHSFSLTKATRASANRAVTVAIAACALEFEHEPDISALLARIGTRLGRSDELKDVWESVRVPLLGEPCKLTPEQVGGTEPTDELRGLLGVPNSGD